MSARIGCRDLLVRAGHRTLLTVDALDVAAGETLAVLGANGAGKSTLVRALAMLSPGVSGTVLLDGVPATRTAVRAAVAAVLQRPVLRRGTAAANAASGLRMRGARRAEARDAGACWLDRLGIGHLAGQDARTLSGGETQRVALARALAVAPRVLVLDEPFAALDATTRADLVADLRGALAELGATALLVTHDRDEAAALADRTALLVRGELRQLGPTADVLDQPSDVDCARLVGYANVLPDGLVARPEHTAPCSTEVPDGAVTACGPVRRIVPLGGITRIDVDTPGGVLSSLVTGPAPAGLTVGAPLTLAVPAGRLRRLDRLSPDDERWRGR